jgi:outer membrane protein insertion porin family
MPQNDDVRFTSSSLKVPLPPQPSPFKFPFCSQTLASQMAKTRNSLAQLIDSVKTRSDFKRFGPEFSHFWNRFPESRKSSLLCSASLSLNRSDESTQAESFGTQKSGSRSRYGKEEEQRLLVPKSSLLCSASLALTRPDEPATQGDSSGREAQPKGHSTSRVYDEERVLISEVLVRNRDGEELERKDLEMEALQALKACRANSALTVLEVQEDVHRIIHSGYFSSCIPVAVDTRDGIRLVFQV